ncbi:MAG: LLM class flavin-dependent oxidoreductase [Dehalococcoidia bacterium]
MGRLSAAAQRRQTWATRARGQRPALPAGTPSISARSGLRHRGRPNGPLATGISVVPAPAWTAVTLAMQAATVGELTGGRFTLGIVRATPTVPCIVTASVCPMWRRWAMRDYLTVVRALLAGEAVNHAGRLVRLRGVQLAGVQRTRVPVYLAALGPLMMRLAARPLTGWR